jgi:hypothetical protein
MSDQTFVAAGATITLNKHVKIFQSALRRVLQGRATFDASDFYVAGDDGSDDVWVTICDVELTITIPEADHLRLAALAGLEAEETKVRAKAQRELVSITQQKQELMALGYDAA